MNMTNIAELYHSGSEVAKYKKGRRKFCAVSFSANKVTERCDSDKQRGKKTGIDSIRHISADDSICIYKIHACKANFNE